MDPVVVDKSLRGRAAATNGSGRVMTVMDKPRFGDVVVAAVLAALLGIYLYTAPTVEDYGSDTSIYFETARSLLHEHRYWFNEEPHTLYPPGFPLILAAIMSITGETYPALTKVLTVMSLVGLAGAYILIKKLEGMRMALFITLLTAGSFAFYYFSIFPTSSDVAYFTATVFALLSFELQRSARSKGQKIVFYSAAAVLVAFIPQIRSIGIAFAAGLFLWMINPLQPIAGKAGESPLKRIQKWGTIVFLSFGLVLLWQHWASQNSARSDGANYMNSYSQQVLKEDPHQIDSPRMTLKKVPERMLNMLAARAVNAAGMVSNLRWLHLKWTNPLVFLPAFLMVIGLLSSLIRSGRLLDWYLLSYTGVLLLWPFDEGQRFLFPVQPFLYLYLIIGAALVYDSFKSHTLRKYVPLAGIVSGALSVHTLAQYLRGLAPSKQDIVSAVLWLVLCGISAALWLSSRESKRKNSQEGKGPLSQKMSVRRAAGLAFVAVVLVGVSASGAAQIYSLAKENVHKTPDMTLHHDVLRASEWIDDHAEAGDVVVADDYAIVHRLTKRKALRFPLTTDTEKLRDAILRNKVRYLIVLNEKKYEYFEPSTFKRFARLQTVIPGMVRPVHEFEGGTIYEVL